MKINSKLIKTFNPCKDRYDKYQKFYQDKEFSLRQFADLEEITSSDKVWVLARLLNVDSKAVFCLDASMRCLEMGYETRAGWAADYAADADAYIISNAVVYTANSVADTANSVANAAASYNSAADAANAAYAAADLESIEIMIYLLDNQNEEM
jgi:hypothetical protein